MAVGEGDSSGAIVIERGKIEEGVRAWVSGRHAMRHSARVDPEPAVVDAVFALVEKGHHFAGLCDLSQFREHPPDSRAHARDVRGIFPAHKTVYGHAAHPR